MINPHFVSIGNEDFAFRYPLTRSTPIATMTIIIHTTPSPSNTSFISFQIFYNSIVSLNIFTL